MQKKVIEFVGIGIVIYSILVGVFYLFVIAPQKKELVKMEREKKVSEGLYVKLKSSLAIKRLEVEKEEISRFLESFEAKGFVAHELLVKLESEGRETGGKIYSLGHKKIEDSGKGILKICWEIGVSGSYDSLGKFFDRIEKHPSLFSISNLKISSGKANSHRAEFTLCIYRFSANMENK